MDDLRPLREFRSETPEPGPDWLRTERRRFLAGTRRRRPYTLLATAAAAVAAAVIVPLAMPAEPAPTDTAAPATAATATPPLRLDSEVVLARAATVAERRTSTSKPRPTQWHYTKTLDKQAYTSEVETREGWIRYDGKQTAWNDDGKLTVQDVPPDPGDDDLSPQQYDAKLRALPTDPEKLLAKVVGDRHWIDLPREDTLKNTESANDRAFRVLTLYLSRYGTMPPRLEAAMFRALARVPGVRIEQGVADAAGRSGLGVWLDTGDDTVRRYVVLDPTDYRYLGHRMLWLKDEYLGGDLVGRAGEVWTTALTVSAIVDRPGQRP
ncbi:CU044_5270 family protein [Nonomuraea longicatena]|uniref:CU044_5270 family protein n=1 Tax=Nonomuraea longicatena TaxID=83682 RepID=A0ABP4AC10_9ACTN